MKTFARSMLPMAIIAALCMLVYVGCSDDDEGNGVTPPPSTKGQLEVNSTPSGAQIFIDDVNQSQQTPYTFDDVDSGTHTVKLTKTDYQDWTGSTRVPAGEKATVNATLLPVAAEVGTLVVNSTPTGAAIFLDGLDQQTVTNDTLFDVEEGNHSVRLVKNGYQEWLETVSVVANQVNTVNATLSSLTFTLDIDTVGGGGVTVDPLKDEYEMNDVVEIANLPIDEWKFHSWVGNITSESGADTSRDSSITVVMNTDRTITANFGLVARVTGTISLPGETLVQPIAFVDTSHNDSFIVVLESTGFLADPGTGEFAIEFVFMEGDTIEGIITGWDNVDGDSYLDNDEPAGWWDINSDGFWNSEDMVDLVGGDTITGAEVILQLPSLSPVRKSAGNRIQLK